MKHAVIGAMILMVAGTLITHWTFFIPWVPAFIGSGVGVVVYWSLMAIDYYILRRNTK